MPALCDHVHHAAHAPSAGPGHRDVSATGKPGCVRPDGCRDVRRLFGYSVHQPVAGGERGRARKETAADFSDRRLTHADRGTTVGALADRFGKLLVFRIVALISACLILVVTNLPVVPLAAAALVVGLLMVSNAGRMATSMSMITASVASRFRGGLMSANSAVQHVAAGLGAYVGGQILIRASDGTLQRFNLVGLVSVAATLFSLWLAGRVKSVIETSQRSDTAVSMATAASDHVAR